MQFAASADSTQSAAAKVVLLHLLLNHLEQKVHNNKRLVSHHQIFCADNFSNPTFECFDLKAKKKPIKQRKQSRKCLTIFHFPFQLQR